jgi:hypothetical protein
MRQDGTACGSILSHSALPAKVQFGDVFLVVLLGVGAEQQLDAGDEARRIEPDLRPFRIEAQQRQLGIVLAMAWSRAAKNQIGPFSPSTWAVIGRAWPSSTPSRPSIIVLSDLRADQNLSSSSRDVGMVNSREEGSGGQRQLRSAVAELMGAGTR